MRRQGYKDGDQRIRWKFLLVPWTLPNKDGAMEERWLENAAILETLEQNMMGELWIPLRWEN